MIVINEYEYVRKIMESNTIPDNMSIKKLLLYIAKYYYNENFGIKEYKDFIFNKVNEFNLPQNYYQEYKYISYVENICKKLLSKELSYQLRKVESVNIYKSEINIIEKCNNDKEKKVLFTLYVLAKTVDNDGWVNYELKDIFSLANVTATIKDRALLIHDIYKDGLLQQTHKNDKLGYKVELGSDDEEIIITINSFENIGNQYIAKFKPGWKMCECCGKLFKIKIDEGRPKKYCKQCAYKIKLKQVNDCKAKKKEKSGIKN